MRTRTLPRWVQEAFFTIITIVSRLRVRRRTTRLPVLGQSDHLSAVFRVPPVAVPMFEVSDHSYLYPPETVHITVASLDTARVDVDTALETLQKLQLRAPRIRVGGIGCSPDTIFLRCFHDRRFGELRMAVNAAFDVERPELGRRLVSNLTLANVVRFDGPGWWPGQVRCTDDFIVTSLEIVRTDRLLSDVGTTVLAKLPLV
jgi:hypothetical protein